MLEKDVAIICSIMYHTHYIFSIYINASFFLFFLDLYIYIYIYIYISILFYNTIFKLSLFNFYLTNSFEIFRDGMAGYRKSKYKFSSHSEKLCIFSKITRFYLNFIITLFYTLVLVLIY